MSNKIQKRWDSRVATVIGLILGILLPIIFQGFFDSLSSNSADTAVLAAFSFFGIFSFASFYTWQSTLNKYDDIEVIHETILEKVSQNAELVPYTKGYRQLAEWANSAEKEILILTHFARDNYWALDPEAERTKSDERQIWFTAANEAIDRTLTTNLQFHRIIQLGYVSPAKKSINNDDKMKFHQDIVKETLNYNQIEKLVGIGKSNPQKASVRLSPTYFTNTFVLIDGKFLFLNFDEWNKDAKKYTSPFVLLATDQNGELFKQLHDLHKRVSAFSQLVEFDQ